MAQMTSSEKPHWSPIKRSEGVTPAERYLKRLCDSTFLTLWSYPTVYRDQRSGTHTIGKEVCDLLVVFGEDIIIFSDKYCSFPETGNLELEWSRWFRHAITKSAHQAWGAERWIRSYPERLFLDGGCTQRFPFSVPSRQARFHLVVVAHDVARRCAQELGGSGSLMIDTDLRGASNHCIPFMIGDLDPRKSFIHVLDDASLNILLQTLDTISDFTAYLRKKEELLRSGKTIAAAGEEELLACYLKDMNSNGEHDFVFPEEFNCIILEEGFWKAFEKNPQRLAQIKANDVSYLWDRLIETFNYNALNGTQEYCWPAAVTTIETTMRFLARESRTRRRMLGRAIEEILASTPPNIRALRVIVPSKIGYPYYVFLLFPVSPKHSYETNRTARLNYLKACCQVTKTKFPEALDIVGIATESGIDNQSRSEDAVYINARCWTDENDRTARALQQELGILVSPTQMRGMEREYPDVATSNSI